MDVYKKLTTKFFKINISFIVLFTILLFIYDPLYLYHKSWIDKNERLHSDMRIQGAGVINNYDFDSIILGSSMLMGMSSKQADKYIGGNFVNLSASGISIFERKFLMEYALNRKSIKKIIISMDTGLGQNLIKSNKKFPISKFDFLYDNSSLNDIKAYWNYKFMSCLLFFSKSSNCLGIKRKLKRENSWFDIKYEKNKKISGIQGWLDNKGRAPFIARHINKIIKKTIKNNSQFNDQLKKSIEIVDESIIYYVKSYQSKDFIVIFPPYSRLYYSILKNKDPLSYKLYIETVKYLVHESEKYSNLEIYSFDDNDYLDDINNYRDLRHYNFDMYEIMTRKIAEKKSLITTKNFKNFMKKVDIKNTNYEFETEMNAVLESKGIQ